MASPPPSVTVSPVDAARAAYHHTRSQLFPIRPEKWLVLGLLAFLDQCGRAFRGGGGSSGGGDGHGPGGPGGWPPDLGHVGARVQQASEWLAAHATLVALGAVAGLLAFGVVAAVVLWLNARGVFMYADAVATGRAEVSPALAAARGRGLVLLRLEPRHHVRHGLHAALRGRPGGGDGVRLLRRSAAGDGRLADPRRHDPGAGAPRARPPAARARRPRAARLRGAAPDRHGAALRRRGSPARVAGRRPARRVRPLPAAEGAGRGRDRCSSSSSAAASPAASASCRS